MNTTTVAPGDMRANLLDRLDNGFALPALTSETNLAAETLDVLREAIRQRDFTLAEAAAHELRYLADKVAARAVWAADTAAALAEGDPRALAALA